jgi:hypothetical protein
VAFWSLVLMAPIVFRRSSSQGRRLSTRARWTATAAVAVAIIIAGGVNVNALSVWLYELLYEQMPGEAWTVMGGARNAAFLAGPLAIAVLMLRRGTAAQPRSLHTSTAMLFSLLSVTVASLLVGANVVGLFHGITGRGMAVSAVALTSSASDSAVALRNGLLMALACLAGAGAMSLRAWRSQDGAGTVARPAMPGLLAFGLCGILGVTLLSVDQLLRSHHEAMGWIHALIDPAAPAGRAGAVADGLAISLGAVLVGGAVLTVVVLTAGVVTWRATRGRAPHRLFTWASRAAIVIAIAGAAYHTRVVVTNLAAFYETVDELRAKAGLPPR